MSRRASFATIIGAMCAKPLIAYVAGSIISFQLIDVHVVGLLMLVVLSWLSILPVWDLVQRSIVGWRRPYAKVMLAQVFVVEAAQLVLQTVFWATPPGGSTDALVLFWLPVYGFVAHLIIMVVDKMLGRLTSPSE